VNKKQTFIWNYYFAKYNKVQHAANLALTVEHFTPYKQMCVITMPAVQKYDSWDWITLRVRGKDVVLQGNKYS
jgi:hypothetical protein